MRIKNKLFNALTAPRYFGVFPYRMKDKFVLSHVDIAYSVAFNVFFVGLSAFRIYVDTRNIVNNYELKIAFINAVEHALMISAIFVCSFDFVGKSIQLNFLCNAFKKVDSLFERLGVEVHLNRNPWRAVLKWTYLWPIYTLIGWDLERYIREGYRSHEYIHHYFSFFGHIFCNTKLFGIAMAFSAFTEPLGDYFTTLNSAVTTYDTDHRKRSLHVISELYDCLFEIIYQINSVFASTLLIMVLNCFVKSTDNFYKIIRGDDSLYWSAYFAIWMAVVIMQLLMLVQSVTYPLKQANLYEWLMYKRMKNEPPSYIGPSHTKLTLHLMRRKKATFDLCGFATLDNGLLGKISAATLTYSIVLSQLSSYPLASIGVPPEGEATKK